MLAAALTWQPGCISDDARSVPRPDRAMFEQVAYPVLLRDCAFPACHGSNERFFQVFGPGRVRMEHGLDIFAPATATELAHSYDRARAMLLAPEEAEGSLLLRKPLESTAGGAGHAGTDGLGRDVYRDRDEEGYRTLLLWARSVDPDAGAFIAQ